VRHMSWELENSDGNFVSRSRSTATHARGFEAMSKLETAFAAPVGRLVLKVVIVCASVWLLSGRALAQDDAPDFLPSTAPSTLWLLEGPKSNPRPHLVIGMLDREDRPFGSSLHLDARETPQASRKYGAISENSSSDTASSPIVVTSLSDSPGGTDDRANLRSDSASGRASVQAESGRDSKIYGFLDEASAEGMFLAADRMKEVLAKQWSESDETFASEDEYDSSPLVQFKLGDWQFPVALSTAAVSK
jgi:hypothetical protein